MDTIFNNMATNVITALTNLMSGDFWGIVIFFIAIWLLFSVITWFKKGTGAKS